MHPVGENILTVERKGKRRNLKFINNPNKPSLSDESCKQLGLLKAELDPKVLIHIDHRAHSVQFQGCF